jgi:hypothetical protein
MSLEPPNPEHHPLAGDTTRDELIRLRAGGTGQQYSDSAQRRRGYWQFSKNKRTRGGMLW